MNGIVDTGITGRIVKTLTIFDDNGNQVVAIEDSGESVIISCAKKRIAIEKKFIASVIEALNIVSAEE